MELKVNDTVKVIWNMCVHTGKDMDSTSYYKSIGLIGVISEFKPTSTYPYSVKFDKFNECFVREDLELVNNNDIEDSTKDVYLKYPWVLRRVNNGFEIGYIKDGEWNDLLEGIDSIEFTCDKKLAKYIVDLHNSSIEVQV